LSGASASQVSRSERDKYINAKAQTVSAAVSESWLGPLEKGEQGGKIPRGD
jgi:hypothetical protein